MRRAALAAALIAVCAAHAPAGAASSDLIDTLAIDSNAWAAWKITLPPDAEFNTYTVSFDGFVRGGRFRFDTWVLRPPYELAVQGGLAGSSSGWQTSARVQTDSSTGLGATVEGGNVFGIEEEHTALLGGLRLGDNIIVAVVAGAFEPVWGTLSLSVPKSNGPPAIYDGRAWGTRAFHHTEYDFRSDEAFARASIGAVQASWIHNARLHEEIRGRFFGLFNAAAQSAGYEGPEEGIGCGGYCWSFRGTDAGAYTFMIETSERAGVFTGEVMVFGADVDLGPLI